MSDTQPEKAKAVPLLLQRDVSPEAESILDVIGNFEHYISTLQEHGVKWSYISEELRKLAAMLNSVGAHKGSGVRVSLGNLIRIHGLDFTRPFLNEAHLGTKLVKYSAYPSVWLAELQWLDLVGDSAQDLLDGDEDLPILHCLDYGFYSNAGQFELNLESLTEGMTEQQKINFEKSVDAKDWQATKIEIAACAYILSHPSLEIIEGGKDGEWGARVAEIAKDLLAAGEIENRQPKSVFGWWNRSSKTKH
ncbi:hypothetical protein [Pontivivens insulae]|uniref:Uncharacterized protein n=1 Tax=Pontivivens insulae TaxID=1639689 RepID=A0A2R8AEA8_9RHOB|nr:hypothetical protein [Pontivivens insulae]RED11789.1 hypothetical protein DFR53_2499 [Pontivivens insulae]SPF30546.1 hypothetical protein POI8812_02885 [Pontivivens insulae]